MRQIKYFFNAVQEAMRKVAIPSTVILSGVIVKIAFDYFLTENSVGDFSTGNSTLPVNCSHLSLTSGNLNNGTHIVLLGEFHNRKDLTRYCFDSLLALLPHLLKNLTVYLEGNTNEQIQAMIVNRNSVGINTLCAPATQCLSWDHPQAFLISSRIVGAHEVAATFLWVLEF